MVVIFEQSHATVGGWVDNTLNFHLYHLVAQIETVFNAQMSQNQSPHSVLGVIFMSEVEMT